MDKYVRIIYDKQNKTQRFAFVLMGSGFEQKLNERHIPYTNHLFVGKYEKGKNFKDMTYKYAQKWQWLTTIDLTK